MIASRMANPGFFIVLVIRDRNDPTRSRTLRFQPSSFWSAYPEQALMALRVIRTGTPEDFVLPDGRFCSLSRGDTSR